MTQRQWDRLRTGVGAAVLIAALLAMVYLLIGCAPSAPPGDAAAPLQRLEEAPPRITGSADRIDAAAPGNPPVQVETAALRVVAGEVGDSAAELRLTVSQQGAALRSRDAQIEKLQADLEETRSKARAYMARALAGLGVLCVLGLSASAVLLIFRPSKAVVALAVGSAVALAASVGVAYYMRQIAMVVVVVVGVTVVVSVAALAWQYFRRHRAVNETVPVAEKTKQYLNAEQKAAVFDEFAEATQSPATKRIVAQARKTMTRGGA